MTATYPEAPPRPSERLRYLLFGRLIPGVLFGLLGFLQLRSLGSSWRQALDSGDPFGVLGGPLAGTFYLLFCAIPVLIYITRPMPRARDGGLLARVAAFAGTLILVAVGPLTPGPAVWRVVPLPVLDIAAIALLLATALEVFTLLWLRHSFSIIPEARRLVSGGPYRYVRHPLYAAEIVVGTSAMVRAGIHLVPALAVVVFIGLQTLRMRYEERLLAAHFPEYEAYSRATARLIPGVW